MGTAGRRRSVEWRRRVIGSWRMMNGFKESGVVGLVCGREMRSLRIGSGGSGGFISGTLRKVKRYSLN